MTGVSYIFKISSKSGFHISGNSMLDTCSNLYDWGYTIFLWFPPKVASIFLDLVCSVNKVTITNGVSYHSSMISCKSCFNISGKHEEKKLCVSFVDSVIYHGFRDSNMFFILFLATSTKLWYQVKIEKKWIIRSLPF